MNLAYLSPFGQTLQSPGQSNCKNWDNSKKHYIKNTTLFSDPIHNQRTDTVCECPGRENRSNQV